MENWKKDSRKEPVIVDIDALVPKDHLLRKIEKVMDYEWLYERLDPYYCHDNGRPGTDPVVLIKMVLIQHRAGLGEEGSELCQAALKMRRVLTQINRTPVTFSDALADVLEEIADVYNYMDFLGIREATEQMAVIEEIRKNKLRRMLAERYKQ